MFKMNLYPLNFPDTNDRWWGSLQVALTGFDHKTCYRAWCMEHRFPFIRKLVETHAPSVLVCLGQKMTTDFRLAFAPRDKLHDKNYFAANSFTLGDEIAIESFLAFNGKTHVLIVPFFGYGHMGNESLTQLADEIKQRCLRI